MSTTVHETPDKMERARAAQLLLSDAERTRDQRKQELSEAQKRFDEAQQFVDSLRSIGESIATDLGNEIGTDESASEVSSSVQYGAIKNAVHKVLLEAHKRLTMSEICARFEKLGVETGAKSTQVSVRNAMRALMKEKSVKRSGLYYRAIQTRVPEPQPEERWTSREPGSNAEIFVNVIRDADGRIHVKDIWRQAQVRGAETKAANPRRNCNATLAAIAARDNSPIVSEGGGYYRAR